MDHGIQNADEKWMNFEFNEFFTEKYVIISKFLKFIEKEES